jgi:hypothetical protein
MTAVHTSAETNGGSVIADKNTGVARPGPGSSRGPVARRTAQALDP